MKKELIFAVCIILGVNSLYAQSTNATNAWNNSRFLGWDGSNNNNPLTIRTNNITRMHINGNMTGYGVNTSGFIGVGMSNPGAPVHIFGATAQNNQGWRRGLTLSNNAALVFDGGAASSFFMAHPSSSPIGNWYAGAQTSLDAGAGVDYAFSVYVNNVIGTLNPLNSTQFFKNLLVYQDNFGRRMGVNTLNPQLAAEVYSNANQLRLSYGAAASTNAVPSVFTDFFTNTSGNLQIMPTGQRVSVNLNANPTSTLDVNGNVRIRDVQSATPNSILVGVNANGQSDVNVRRLDFTGNANQVLLGNGTWGTLPSGGGYFSCTSTAAFMPTDSRFAMNNNNFYFEQPAIGLANVHMENRVGIGWACGTAIRAKLDVLQQHPSAVSINSTAISGLNRDVSNAIARIYIGVDGFSRGVQVPALRITNIGGSFRATGGRQNYGARTIADNQSGPSDLNVGLYANADGSLMNYGVWAEASMINALNRAGKFVGEVEMTNQALIASDQQFKIGLNGIEGLQKVLQLQPTAYLLDTAAFPSMNFSSKQQYGFIAQEVETILPEVIHASFSPEMYDTLGNIISPAISYKSMNYNAIIPINTQAIKELNQKVENLSLSDQSIKTNVVNLNNSLAKVLSMNGVSFDWTPTAQASFDLENTNQIGFIAQNIQQIDARLTFVGTDSLLHVKYEKVVPLLAEAIQELNTELLSKDSIINAINARLTTLENCLSGILPFLCQLNHSAVQTNTPEAQNAIRAQLEVKLSNQAGIVLDQNVPNPFAEQTIIHFSIPETVKKAQIHFYNMQGRIIQSVEINERGLGSLTVFGSDLSTGTYTYTLVADGINVATKKMVKN